MISDVLSDAVSRLDYYLTKETYHDMYTGPVRTWILDLRRSMNTLRFELDKPPNGRPLPDGSVVSPTMKETPELSWYAPSCNLNNALIDHRLSYIALGMYAHVCGSAWAKFTSQDLYDDDPTLDVEQIEQAIIELEEFGYIKEM